jgi:hypothetical protein
MCYIYIYIYIYIYFIFWLLVSIVKLGFEYILMIKDYVHVLCRSKKQNLWPTLYIYLLDVLWQNWWDHVFLKLYDFNILVLFVMILCISVYSTRIKIFIYQPRRLTSYWAVSHSILLMYFALI